MTARAISRTFALVVTLIIAAFACAQMAFANTEAPDLRSAEKADLAAAELQTQGIYS